MDAHSDRVKFLMSEERKQWHNPETVLKNVGVAKGMTMVDFGSGPGFFTIPMAKATGEKGLVYAVDSNFTMLNALKENITKSGVDSKIVEIINSDVSHMGIPKGSVDIVLFANVLHEVGDRKAFFQEVKRISKPTAHVVNIDWKKIQTEYGPPLRERLSEDEAKQLLSENGFKVIKQTGLGPYHYELICRLTAQ
jgi:ubiquinone/menaquinone biosynthesis C-methylase UbiE